MRNIFLLVLATLFFACGGTESNDKPSYHPDAMSLQIEAMKVYHRKPDSALAVLDKAIQMDESYYLAYNSKALVYITKQEYDRAIAELYKSLRWNDSQAEVHLQLGVLHDEVGAAEPAQDAYQEALALFDMRIAEGSDFILQDRTNRAVSLIMTGQEEKGVSLLQSLHNENGKDPLLTKIMSEVSDSTPLTKAYLVELLFLDN
ncbi:tetratricopeptide repeat protein [Sanyastnella coralliicola]|uniref:tetratricopeptide repeat protein n=1 Tax=Sanyastnella coralliicola TaxID=3069118 RepID=UPI0027BAA7BF|nr:hypothetical protein [Longitalea sp. SCSIO 12813]